MCRLLGLDRLADDVRFRHREDRLQNRDQLHDLIQDALATHDSAHWERTLSDAGVPAGRVLTVAEAIGHEQLRQRGLIHRLPSGESGDTVAVLGNGIRVDGNPSAPRSGPPLLGAHTNEILAEIGFSDADIRRVRGEGGV